jgi:hypothetical protein
MIEDVFEKALTGDLQNRLNMIIQEVPYFWERGPHAHFTLSGPAHSERVHRQKLAQLAQELPEDQRLTQDEIFIVSAAACLYEIGMQCTNLRPTLDIDWHPGIALSPEQLQQVREKKHLLTYRMIRDSVRRDYDGPRPRLGLLLPDEYTELIAEVCRWCSPEPIEQVPEKLPVSGLMVRVRLLVALLRLADQLYIDSARVNLDLLQAAQLPARQEARWWVYHYTQTLPIDKGLIKFHYFLPQIHRPLLGHIRALIEPDFERDINPIIKHLWDKHRLKLLPDEPSVRYDQPSGFQREMNQEMLSYLRHIQPREKQSTPDSIEREGGVGERCLLVLDYENFLLQLGLEGHFLSPEEVSRKLVTLLKEARTQFGGTVDGLAAGHWSRPDLQPIAKTLQDLTYTLLPVNEQTKTSEALLQELHERLQSARLPKNVLLIAPHQALAPIVKQFDEQRQSIGAWATDTDETYIYQALVHNCKALSQVLKLPSTQSLDSNVLETTQEACILRLDDRLATSPNGLAFAEVLLVLQQVAAARTRTGWWRLWLLHKDILTVKYAQDDYVVHLNKEHPIVEAIYKKRTALILALTPFVRERQGVPQDQLFKSLIRNPAFQGMEEQIISFLTLLRDEDIVAVDAQSSALGDQPRWQLNDRHQAVVALTADNYLPFLVLGMDHAMVQTGQPVIHEHTLKGRLRSYIEPMALDAVYQSALDKGWVQRINKVTASPENAVGVEPIMSKAEVREVMLNRDILLDVLYRKAANSGLQRNALWFEVSKIRRFTLKRNEFNQWLTVFQRDGLIQVERDINDTEKDCLHLRVEMPLVQLLLGRINIYGVILALRILRATNMDAAKPIDTVIESLARRTTRRNRHMAAWALDYAKKIRLVGFTRANASDTPGELLFLNKHRIVYRLDQCETGACQALTELVRRLSLSSFQNGGVPQPVLMQEMGKNPLFGYTHSEYEYWINQAIHRYKKLESIPEPGGYPSKFLIRLVTQEHH